MNKLIKLNETNKNILEKSKRGNNYYYLKLNTIYSDYSIMNNIDSIYNITLAEYEKKPS